jgi:hypothetical protein
MKTSLQWAAALLLSTLNSQLFTARAQGTAFSYQGQLQNNGAPASGTYNLQFTLYASSAGGAAVAGPAISSAVFITNGLFTVVLDFGPGIFTGAPLWMQIGAETNGGGGGFTLLTPLQPLTPTPYAIYAENSGGVNNSTISAPQLNTLGAPSSGQVLAYNGTSLVWLNQEAGGGNSWSLTGNAGTSPGTGNFLGTTDNNPLELHVDGVRAWQLAPTTDTPNVIGGAPGNYVATDVQGATIGGGGTITTYGQSYSNVVLAYHGTIGGGLGNVIQTSARESTIAGGRQNLIQEGTTDAFIGGGEDNKTSGQGATVIGGGYQNETSGTCAAIGGGENNQVNADTSTIGGGIGNTASGTSSTIAGGENNQASGDTCLIGGGNGNTASGISSTIAGGENNQASGSGSFVGGGGFDDNLDITNTGNTASGAASTVAGGLGNHAGNTWAAVGGGYRNSANGSASTVPGGSENTASGTASFASGQNAIATDSNSFVWGDGTRTAVSQGTDTFTVLATGGAYFFTTTSGLNVAVDNNADLDFGSTTRQMINLWSTSYGIGVQNNDEYFRTADQFYWYEGGLHNNNQGNSGGGTTLMSLSASGLTVNGTFVSASDRNLKENFQPVNAQQVLARVSALPISKWNYKADTASEHIGPMAQDFYAAFNVGPDDKHITTVDEGGVALAAIQGLNQKDEEKEARIKEQESKIQHQAAEITELKTRLEALENLFSIKNRIESKPATVHSRP